MLVKDIMNTQVVSVSPDTCVSEVVAVMLREHLSVVPVIEHGALVGLVREADLMHRHEIGTQRDPASRPWWLRLMTGEQCPATYVESHAVKVADIMITRVASASEDTSIPEVVDLLDACNLRRIPVVRAGTLVGSIGRADLVRALAAAASPQGAEPPMEDEAIHRALRAELESQPWWRPTQSHFTVIAGVVHFRGLVESADEVAASRVAAQRLPGVQGIVDHRLDTSGWGWLSR